MAIPSLPSLASTESSTTAAASRPACVEQYRPFPLPPLLLLPFHLSLLRSIPSHSVPFPAERRLQSCSQEAPSVGRPQFPSSSSPPPFSSFFPNSPAYFSSLSLSPPHCRPPRSSLGLFWERGGEKAAVETDGGGGERGRGNVYYVRDGAKSKMGKRSSDSEGGRARNERTNEQLVIKGRERGERASRCLDALTQQPISHLPYPPAALDGRFNFLPISLRGFHI